MNVVDCSGWNLKPDTLVSIQWEVDGASGSTECVAWKAQHEIEMLERAGYTVLDVVPWTS